MSVKRISPFLSLISIRAGMEPSPSKRYVKEGHFSPWIAKKRHGKVFFFYIECIFLWMLAIAGFVWVSERGPADPILQLHEA